MLRAARLDEVPAGSTRLVRVEGRPVLLANCAGQVYACVAVCPHRNNPLEGARVENGQIECPWHHFRYDARTGENVYPRNVYPLGAEGIDQQCLLADLRPLRLYPVEIRDGEILVGL